MENVIAVIWDFDKTLIDGYMQDPMFAEYGVDAGAFWKNVNELPERYLKEQGVKVNPDTIYLNEFIKYARAGKFPGLNNEKLREFGKKQVFYPGVPEIFEVTRRAVSEVPAYQEFDIKVEHYIVSTGFAKVIEGSEIMNHVDGIWGCELIEDRTAEPPVISEVAYTIDNTTKTRALFEINKGVNKHSALHVNSPMAEEDRRVSFKNMIYIADGPSDVPAFSLVRSRGGAAFAIYPEGNLQAFDQVEELRENGRIDTYSVADYTEGREACTWICRRIKKIADGIVAEENEKLGKAGKGPRHLNVEE